jgi:Zn-dependent peptidase ImmA (M78 family)/DNA-binding XRE family transcriptional regulator
MSQSDAAEGIGVSRPTLIAVEQGRRRPLPGELVEFARLYGRQVHELVRETPPVEALSTRFRLASRSGESDTQLAVDDLQRLAEDVYELEGDVGAPTTRRWPDVYDIQGLPIEAAAEQVADAERRRLGLGDGPLVRLREVLEDDVGLRVFAIDMPSPVAGLFAVAEPVGGCIAVNARHPHERQRWTLAHEYAHFLLHRNDTEVTGVEVGRGRAERLAEAFASRFLLPAEGLTRRFQVARRSREGAFTPVDLLQLASLYEVSAQAMALRLEDLHLVGGGWWDSLVERGLRVQDARAVIGLPGTPRDRDVLPRRAQYLAVEAYLGGELSEGRLVHLLRSDRVAARQLVRRLTASQDVESGGAVQSWAWEPAATGDAAG